MKSDLNHVVLGFLEFDFVWLVFWVVILVFVFLQWIMSCLALAMCEMHG